MKSNFSINNFQTRIRNKVDPRSKILREAGDLEDWELIAISLGKGTKSKNVEELSHEILNKFKGISGLINATARDLLSIKGIGSAKASAIISIIELMKRMQWRIPLYGLFSEENLIKSIQSQLIKERRENFILVTISPDNIVLRNEVIAKGSLCEVGVGIRDIIKIILNDGAKYVLISHNHPVQFFDPSEDDWKLYDRFSNLLSEFNIELIDQWIVGIEGIFSCKKNNRIDLVA